jgi:predicted PurR-regulated permease PerM
MYPEPPVFPQRGKGRKSMKEAKPKDHAVPPSSRGNGFGRKISFAVLVVVICVIGYFLIRVMSAFLLPLFVAVLLAVVCEPFHCWLQRKFPKSPALAAAIATVLIFLLILAPISFAITFAVSEGVDLAYGDLRDIPDRLGRFRSTLALEIPLQDKLETLNQHLQQLANVADKELPQLQLLADGLNRLRNDVTELEEIFAHAGEGPDSPPPYGIDREQWNEAKDQLQQLGEVVQETQVLIANGIREGSMMTNEFENQIREGLQIAVVRGTKFRQAMLGGVPWSWLVELANPSKVQINSWRQQAGRTLQGWLVKLTGQTTALVVNIVFGIGITILCLFYFFLDGPRMVRAIMHLSPLDDQYEKELGGEFAKVSRAVVLASLLSALAQGLLAGIGFYIAGFDPLFLLIILTTVLALVPFVGAASVWLPACAWLVLVDQRPVAAVVLFLYGAGIISMADNLIKPLILQGQSNIHPLLGLLSVLGGVKAMGPIGILIGPMLVAFLQALLNILHKEMRSMEQIPSS